MFPDVCVWAPPLLVRASESSLSIPDTTDTLCYSLDHWETWLLDHIELFFSFATEVMLLLGFIYLFSDMGKLKIFVDEKVFINQSWALL